jgi:hypothetical protein
MGGKCQGDFEVKKEMVHKLPCCILEIRWERCTPCEGLDAPGSRVRIWLQIWNAFCVQMIGDFRPAAGPGRRGPMGRMQNRHELVADVAERQAVQTAQQLTESASRSLSQVRPGPATGVQTVRRDSMLWMLVKNSVKPSHVKSLSVGGSNTTASSWPVGHEHHICNTCVSAILFSTGDFLAIMPLDSDTGMQTCRSGACRQSMTYKVLGQPTIVQSPVVACLGLCWNLYPDLL